MRIERFAAGPFGRRILDRALDYFSASLEGAEHVPDEGGALLVVNHGPFGFDALLLGAVIFRHAKRIPAWLADSNLWKTPGFGKALEWANAVPGTPDAAVELLRDGKLVIVYPGGIFDSYKLSRDRHLLKWRGRAGFARVAMRAGRPIVPVAACGVDDMYRMVMREPLIGRWIWGDERYNLPVAFGRWGTPLPKPARVRIVAHEPVDTSGNPENDDDVERVRVAVHSAIQKTLDNA